MSPAYAKLKKVPKIESETDATKLLGSIIPYAFYLRVDRGAPAGSSSGPKLLTVNPMQMFGADEYYAWFYDGPQWTTYVGGAIMVGVILAGVMFPLHCLRNDTLVHYTCEIEFPWTLLRTFLTYPPVNE